MYLTDITHDFNFDLKIKKDSIFHSLEFKKSRKPFLSFSLIQSKISFYPNQGRKNYLLKSKNIFSSKNNYTFIIEDVVVFKWKEGSKIIRYKYLKNAEGRLVHYWLLHTFLPLYFYLENLYAMLHVGTVEIEGRAALFAAPSFGGKSTLTHYFIQKGHKLLSDDRLAIHKQNGCYCAVPSYPFARNYRSLEDLGKYIENFSEKPLPITVLYSIIKVGPEDTITISEVKGIKKFSILEMSCDVRLSFLKKEDFIKLNDLVQALLIYEICIPQNYNRLNEVYEKVMEHFSIHLTQRSEI